MHSNPALDPNWHPGFQIMTNDGAVEADVSLCSLPDELFVDEWSLTASALEYSMTTPIGDDEYTGSPLSIELGITPDADTGANPSSLSTLSSVIEPMALTYCPMPWPSDMLQSPQRRFLWHYFIQTASTGLLCLEQDDMRRVPDFCDPFTTILPTMALAHEPLRATVYCLAAAHQQPSIGQDVYHNLTRSASLMVTHAFKSLTPGAHHQDDFTVAVTIVAGIFLKLAGEETGHGHLKSAIMLTAQFLRKSRSWTRLSAPYIQMTLALLRCILNIRKRVNSESTGLCPSHEYENNGLEEALTDAFKKDLMSLSATADSLRLHCLNESMYAAASILFYTRVKKLPLTAPGLRKWT
ncbi:hypothetical protein HG530_013898 [Fusarium avenaceum]|nr:hypothetical protein HG530_013898 [Fusarium avenaceum]